MNLFGETILLPVDGTPPPNRFASIKKVNALEPGTVVKLYYNKGFPKTREREMDEPVVVRILECNYTPVSCNMRVDVQGESVSINTTNDIITEVDPVQGKTYPGRFVTTTPQEEREIIGKIRANPPLVQKVPDVLWDSKRFQNMFFRAQLPVDRAHVPERIITLAHIRGINFVGNKTRNLYATQLPIELTNHIHGFLGIKPVERTPAVLAVEAEAERRTRRGGRRRRTRRKRK
jgi:hypothetical protein